MAQIHQTEVKSALKKKKNRKKDVIDRLMVAGKEQKKEKESKTLGNRETERSQWCRLLDQDQVAGSSISFQTLQIIAVQTLLCFKHRQMLYTTFLCGPHTCTHITQRMCWLSHSSFPEKWWYFSKVISTNLCVWWWGGWVVKAAIFIIQT